MLYIIGLGMADGDITLRGLAAMKRCQAVYCELYTNRWAGDIGKLEEKIKKKIRTLSREEAEGSFLISEAGKKPVALLVPGDPLAATTHFELAFEARTKGVGCEIIHAASVYTAVAETGLQLYKFGRTTTIAYTEKNFSPASPYDVIAMNRNAGLHTLVLLDVKEKKQMTAAEGIEALLRIEGSKKKNLITGKTKLVACCRLGSSDSRIRFAAASEIMGDESLKKTPAALVFPGELNFKEEEALGLWK